MKKLRAHATLGVAASAIAAGMALLPANAGAANKADGPKVPFAQYACRSDERWSFGAPGVVRADFQSDFQEFLNGKLAPVQGFAGGIALRRYGQYGEARALGEYWISRSLLSAKVPHIAFQGFANIAARTPTADTIGVQLAALDCLLQIQAQHPAMTLPSSVTAQLAAYAPLAKPFPAAHGARVVQEAAASQLRAQLGANKPASADVEQTLALVKGGGAFESLSRGLWAAKKGDHANVVRRMEEFLNTSPMPASLKRYVDAAHLEMARSHYSLGHYDQAASQYKLISKSSNELAESLSEMTWAYLMNEKYAETVGTAMNLQAGGLRHTYAPEAPMVMAMALNELCQYPESVRATNMFRKFYEDSYRWLAHWNAAPSDKREALYPKAVEYLKRQGKTPRRIASEWVRSPVFISAQDEINLIFDEEAGNKGLGRSGSVAQTSTGAEVIRLATEIKPQVVAFRSNKKRANDKLPKELHDQVAQLKRQVQRFKRLTAAAPIWRKVLGNYQRNIVGTQKGLMARIEGDLRDRSGRMLNQIEEIAENIQLIEVEIYNGASQDIIWQNAHPDYKEIAQTLTKEHARAQREKVWDWGRTPAGGEENAEIWEDELGSFKADLYDNCSSKDRYLTIKMKKGRMTAHE